MFDSYSLRNVWLHSNKTKTQLFQEFGPAPPLLLSMLIYLRNFTLQLYIEHWVGEGVGQTHYEAIKTNHGQIRWKLQGVHIILAMIVS